MNVLFVKIFINKVVLRALKLRTKVIGMNLSVFKKKKSFTAGSLFGNVKNIEIFFFTLDKLKVFCLLWSNFACGEASAAWKAAGHVEVRVEKKEGCVWKGWGGVG